MARSNALAMLLLDLQHYGYAIAGIFFGLWLMPLGYLAVKSGMFPKALGVVLVVGGASYLVDKLAAFVAPELTATVPWRRCLAGSPRSQRRASTAASGHAVCLSPRQQPLTQVGGRLEMDVHF